MRCSALRDTIWVWHVFVFPGLVSHTSSILLRKVVVGVVVVIYIAVYTCSHGEIDMTSEGQPTQTTVAAKDK